MNRAASTATGFRLGPPNLLYCPAEENPEGRPVRILLFHPRMLEDRIHLEEVTAPPMGLFQVAAALKAAGHEVELINLYGLEAGPEALTRLFSQVKPELIGFSVVNANRLAALEIAALAKRAHPAVRTMLGGPAASSLWRFFLGNFDQVDYVVVGEGDRTVAALARAVAAGEEEGLNDLPGLALRRDGRPRYNGPADRIKDLDRLPDPADWYNFRHLALSRGCPENCRFCGSPRLWGRRVRFYSPAYLVKSLVKLHGRGISHFYISDDTFTLKPELTVEVCRRIIDQGLKITWQAISRIDLISAELLGWMRKAGCIQISYGVEHGDEGIRRTLGKRFGDDQVETAFRLTTAHGIMPRAYFIYGCPGETDDHIRVTQQLIDRIRPLGTVFYILDLFPGTDLYDQAAQRMGWDDDLWLDRREDVLYYETDPELTEQTILDRGERLRNFFRSRISAYADRIELADRPDLVVHQADFLSRLGMTFSRGDYAETINHNQTAESLFRRALDLAPDGRAYLGLALLAQSAGRWSLAEARLADGLNIFPDDQPLHLARTVNLMNQGRPGEALEIASAWPDSPQAASLAAECRRMLGRPD